MAELTTLADSDHIMRFVPYARCEKDDAGNPIGFLPQAFELKVKDGELEEYLSAAWIEYFEASDRDGRIAATINAFKSQPRPHVGAKARFAVGNVGRIRGACKKYNQTVRISHEPVEDFESHASVRQFNSATLELLELLANEAWPALHKPFEPRAR